MSRKASQSVYLLYSDGFCCFVVIRVCMVTMIGVWSDERSGKNRFRISAR
jgi:hypothetical protein